MVGIVRHMRVRLLNLSNQCTYECDWSYIQSLKDVYWLKPPTEDDPISGSANAISVDFEDIKDQYGQQIASMYGVKNISGVGWGTTTDCMAYVDNATVSGNTLRIGAKAKTKVFIKPDEPNTWPKVGDYVYAEGCSDPKRVDMVEPPSYKGLQPFRYNGILWPSLVDIRWFWWKED